MSNTRLEFRCLASVAESVQLRNYLDRLIERGVREPGEYVVKRRDYEKDAFVLMGPMHRDPCPEHLVPAGMPPLGADVHDVILRTDAEVSPTLFKRYLDELVERRRQGWPAGTYRLQFYIDQDQYVVCGPAGSAAPRSFTLPPRPVADAVADTFAQQMADEIDMDLMVAATSDERTVNNTMRHQYRVLTDEEKAQMQRVKKRGQ